MLTQHSCTSMDSRSANGPSPAPPATLRRAASPATPAPPPASMPSRLRHPAADRGRKSSGDGLILMDWISPRPTQHLRPPGPSPVLRVMLGRPAWNATVPVLRIPPPGYHPAGFLTTHPVAAYGRESSCSECHNQAQFCTNCHVSAGLVPRASFAGSVSTTRSRPSC